MCLLPGYEAEGPVVTETKAGVSNEQLLVDLCAQLGGQQPEGKRALVLLLLLLLIGVVVGHGHVAAGV